MRPSRWGLKLLVTLSTALLGMSFLGTAWAADPSSPFFIWERSGNMGAIKSFETSDGKRQEYTPDGLSILMLPDGATYRWEPSERKLVLQLSSGSLVSFFYDAEGYEVLTSNTYGGSSEVTTYELIAGAGRVGTVRDENGALLERITYNALGQRIESHSFRYGRESRMEIEWDAYGQWSERRSYGSDGNLTSAARYEVKYDAQGNWIERTTYEWVPILGRFETDGSTETRSIVYF